MAERLDERGLLGEGADELKAVEKTHAVANYRSQHEKVGIVWNREFERNHFSRGQLAGDDGAETGLGDFKAAAVDANVAILPQHPHNHRYLCAISGVTSSGRLVHSSGLREEEDARLEKNRRDLSE